MAKLVKRAEWMAARAEVLARARGRCEHCGRPDGERVAVRPCGCWQLAAGYVLVGTHPGCLAKGLGAAHGTEAGGERTVEVTETRLVVVHLDAERSGADPKKLAAVCGDCRSRLEEMMAEDLAGRWEPGQ